MKKVITLKERKQRVAGRWPLVLTAALVGAFALLLVVGFDNVLALLRYRVTLFLLLGPLLMLFLWCAYKAFGPGNRP